MAGLSSNQIKVLKYLLQVNRGVPRSEIIECLGLNPTSLQFALLPMMNRLIFAKKERNKQIIFINECGENIVKWLEVSGIE